MIPISKINGNLDIFRENKVYLWGSPPDFNHALGSLSLFRERNIPIAGICVANETVWRESHFQFIPVIKLETLLTETVPVLLQLTLPEIEEDYALFQRLSPLFQGKHQTLLRQGELHAMLPFFRDLEGKSPVTAQEIQEVLTHRTLSERMKALQYFHTQEREGLFLCLPPKTGDHSLIETFQKEGIPHHFVFHNPNFWDPSLFLNQGKRVKIITATRDPKAQLISLMFQMLGDFSQSLTARFLLYGQEDASFFAEGGDVQGFFDLLLPTLRQGDSLEIGEQSSFFKRFQENICPLSGFDVQRGYSIYTMGDLQVFVYQLERLDAVVPALASFVGGDFTSLVRKNEADKKWVAESYRQAKEHLSIPPSDVERWYQASWYRQFYGGR